MCLSAYWSSWGGCISFLKSPRNFKPLLFLFRRRVNKRGLTVVLVVLERWKLMSLRRIHRFSTRSYPIQFPEKIFVSRFLWLRWLVALLLDHAIIWLLSYRFKSEACTEDVTSAEGNDSWDLLLSECMIIKRRILIFQLKIWKLFMSLSGNNRGCIDIVPSWRVILSLLI